MKSFVSFEECIRFIQRRTKGILLGQLALFVALLNFAATGRAADSWPEGVTTSVVSVGKTVTNVNGNFSTTELAKLTDGTVDGDGNVNTLRLDVDNTLYSVVLDLGSKYPVTNVTLNWEGATASEYKIYLSSDNSTWTEVVHETDNPAAAGARPVKSYDIYQAGQYVKLEPLKAGDAGWGVKLYEITVSAAETSTADVNSLCIFTSETNVGVDATVNVSYFAFDANNKVVLNPGTDYEVHMKDPSGVETNVTGQHSFTLSTVGQYLFNYAGPAGKVDNCTVTVAPESKTLKLTEDMVWVEEGSNITDVKNAFDGTDTDWVLHTDPGTVNYNAGFVLDLKGTYDISSIYAKYEGACPADYTIGFSADGKTFTTVKSVTGHAGMTTYDETYDGFNGTDNVGVRYVRFLSTKAATGYGIKIKRFDITAAKTASAVNDGVGPEVSTPTIEADMTSAEMTVTATDNSGEYVYYKLEQVTPAGGATIIDRFTSMRSGEAATFALTGLEPSTTYTFHVTAYDTFGNATTLSDVTFSTARLYEKLTLTADMVWVEEGCNITGAGYAFDGTDAEWILHDNTGNTDEDKSYNAGFVLDLKGTYDISSIYAKYQGACAADYTIGFSADGKTFTNVHSVTGHAGMENYDETIDNFNGTVNAGVRYVRFLSTKAATEYGIKIMRFDITAATVSKETNDETGPTINGDPTVEAAKSSAQLTVTATDNSGEYVYYKLEQKTPAPTAENNATVTDRFTSMHSGEPATFTLNNLSSETAYTFTLTAYDTFGNASTPQDVNITTIGRRVATIQGTVTTADEKVKDVAEVFCQKSTTETTVPAFTVLDDEGDEILKTDTHLNIYYVVISNPQGIIDTNDEALGSDAEIMGGAKYSTDGKFKLDTSKIGTAIVRIYGVYTDRNGLKSYTDQRGYYGINVYGNDLTVTSFKLANGTEYTKNSAAYDGHSGDLKSIINTIAGDGAYLNVEELAVDGTLNTDDLRALRAMGGIKNAEPTTNDDTSDMYIENGSRALINKYRGKDPHHADGDKLDEEYKYNDVNDPEEMYTTEGKCYNETGETYGSLKKLDLSKASFKTNGQVDDTAAKAWYDKHKKDTYPTWDDLLAEETKTAAEVDALDADGKKKHNDWMGYLSEARAYKDIIVRMDGDKDKTTFYSWTNTGGLYNINHFVFMGCINLEEVTLPDYCAAVGEYAFQYCENLKVVKNIDKPEIFGMMAFGNCPKFGNEPTVTFNSDLKQIGYSAFENCKTMKLTNTVLPNSLNLIGTYAFAGCDGLTEITWPVPVNGDISVVHMNTGVFMNCRGLTKFYAPKELETVGYQAFQGDLNLADFKFYDGTNATTTTENSLKNIVGWAFDKCWALKSDDIKNFTNVRLIGSTAFRECKLLDDDALAVLLAKFQDGSDERPFGDSRIGTGLEKDNDHILPASVFDGCISITRAEIPASVIAVEVEAFARCANLQFVDLKGEAVQYIGRSAFVDDTKLRRFRVNNEENAPKCYINYWLADRVQDPDTKEWSTVYSYHDNNPFLNIDPNHVTLEFGADGTSYLTDYRKADADCKEGTEGTTNETATAKNGNAWMYLLTKTMNENGNKTTEVNGKQAGTYEVVEQDHATVKMTRTLNATSDDASRWNSIILPFSLPADSVTKYFGQDAYLAAFGWYAEEGATEKTYIRNNVLQFQKTSEIEAATPYLLRVGTGGTQYQFEDVNIGHYKHIDELADMTPELEELNEVEGAGFTFTGTKEFANVVGINKEQNVLYVTGTPSVFKYRNTAANSTLNVKAFRSFFTYGDELQAKVANLGTLAVFVDDNEVTAIDDINLDDETGTLRGDIYTLGGQLVRRNATTEGLRQGIYIVNGKKVVIK